MSCRPSFRSSLFLCSNKETEFTRAKIQIWLPYSNSTNLIEFQATMETAELEAMNWLILFNHCILIQNKPQNILIYFSLNIDVQSGELLGWSVYWIFNILGQNIYINFQKKISFYEIKILFTEDLRISYVGLLLFMFNGDKPTAGTDIKIVIWAICRSIHLCYCRQLFRITRCTSTFHLHGCKLINTLLEIDSK